MFGVVFPLIFWGFAKSMRMPGAFVLRFFASFGLLAYGLYIGVGSFGHIGDSGEMLRHGSSAWQLWLFGIVTAPVGLWMWHRLGPHFGLGPAKHRVSGHVAHGALAICLALLFLGFVVGGD
jgi:hypothetical protein